LDYIIPIELVVRPKHHLLLDLTHVLFYTNTKTDTIWGKYKQLKYITYSTYVNYKHLIFHQ
jgi:hypothetical protein